MWLVRWIKPLGFALLVLLAGLRLDAQIDRITGKNFATRSEVLARHGMVCTSVPAATQVGVEILKRGGSAVDAAIAANATLGLMEPVSNGIGGDLFAIVYSAKENKLYGINGSGRSPAGLSYDQMKTELAKLHPDRVGIPPIGMLPISVPGTVDAWAELHKKFGKLKLSDDLAPAIRYAEEGFPVTELIAYYWAFGPRLYKSLPGAFLETYTLDGKGRTPAKGDIFKNPDLAKTLQLIGEKGRDVFYKGEIADKIDSFMQANGGFLRKADFAKHASTWVKPVSMNYRGYDIFELPPNGQGIAALEILNMLEGFDLRAMGRNSPGTLHTMIEAKKIAWADRAKFYADPDFAKIPLTGLLSKSYATERRKLIDPDHAAKKVEAGSPALDHGDTIYLCTADDEGNMVSLIQSRNARRPTRLCRGQRIAQRRNGGRVLTPRNGETANGRMGDLARSRVLPCANDPFLWMIDHAHELAEDVFVRVIDCLEFGVTDVAVTKCELDVHLRFGSLAFAIAQLGNESRGITPLPPRLRNVCADGARRTTNLIG